MHSIIYIDRKTKEQKQEEVWGEGALYFLYGTRWWQRFFGRLLLHGIVKRVFFSKCYGLWQKSRFSRKKIAPFVKAYGMDASEFAEPLSAFHSFDHFFTRKLKSGVRPIANTSAVIPADGRYLFFPEVGQGDCFSIKGKSYSLTSLLGSDQLAKTYAGGSAFIARLCPVDYHRFHFPCFCVPRKSQLINGYLYSVNPIALRSNLQIFSENARVLTLLEETPFGQVAYLEVGATCVGSIHQTYTPNKSYEKGEEKGYFSFGGSTLIVLFKKGSICFEEDLLAASSQGLEILCQMGQSLTTA